MKVTIPYDPNWTALAWAKDNCPSYITNQRSTIPRLEVVQGGWVNVPDVDYYFSNERDVVAFSLRWS